MKVMIKTELERAFKSWSLWLALIIGMGLSIAQIITRIIPAAMNPLMGYMPDNATLMPISAFQVWIGNGVSFEYSLFIRLIPILAAMPYAVTYLSDIKSGIIKNYVTRTAKFNYLAAKYIAVFVTGGVVVVMPLLINYLTAITILPSLVWPVGVFASSPKSIWSAIFYTHPHVYMIMYMILLFVCGGLMATIALIVSNIVNNRFVAILAPYIITEFANAILRMSDKKWLRGIAPTKLFNMAQTNTGASFIVYIAVLLILGVVVYFAVVVAVGYIDVNHRFPEPEEEIVEKDEWVQYSDGIKIKVTGIDYCTEREVNEKYSASVKELGRFNYIVLKVKVQNESQDKFNMFSIVTDSNLVIYPDGYENQGMVCEDNVSVDKGEVKDFTLAYVISKNYLSEKKLDKLLHEDIYLCFKAYPVRQAIVIRGIDG